jgi:two-component system phosphate regulon sensor histidine kinase PhoR
MTEIFTKIKGKIFIRTFISYVVIIALVFILIYLFSQNTIRNFYMEELKSQLSQVGYSLKPEVSELYQKGDKKGVDLLVKKLRKQVDIRITVIEPDGTVIADSENNPAEMENHGNRPEIVQALRGKIQEDTRFSSTMREYMLYLAMPVEENGETKLILRVSLFVRQIKQLVNQLKWKITIALLVLFVLALLMAWYFSRGISNPVKEIAAATRKFAAGDFEVKVFPKKKDELGEVALSFNNMVRQQKSLFDKLSENKEELQAIIGSIKEGLLVITPEGRITLCNESFEKIAGKKNTTGSAYWEILRIPDFEHFVKKAMENKESFYEEIELDNQSYMVGFNPMSHGEKVVIIFRDITGFRQLEKMKKDFVVNLTHELKTPLTAIKGFMETLEEEETIKNPQYLEIINRHTERMNQIISDLLVLSDLEDLEEGKRPIEFEPINLEKMVTNILKIYKEKIKKKGLDLEVDIQEPLPPFNGEKFKMEQMFVNLVDNAVKYTDKGKIAIIITTPGEKDKSKYSVEIQVKNTGAPIPAKSLPRLFERFYVVDKSRSRKLGGTGLGLSIVKHVVLLHKGEISADSSPAKGTTFTIRLPLASGKS